MSDEPSSRLGTTRSTRDPPLRPRQTRSPRIERQTDAPGAHRGPEGARDSARRSVEAQTESLRARHASVRIAYEAYERDRRQAGSLLAGGLAYRLFLWLLPAALFAVAVVSLFAEATSRTPEEAADATGLGAALAVTVAEGRRAVRARVDAPARARRRPDGLGGPVRREGAPAHVRRRVGDPAGSPAALVDVRARVLGRDVQRAAHPQRAAPVPARRSVRGRHLRGGARLRRAHRALLVWSRT